MFPCNTHSLSQPCRSHDGLSDCLEQQPPYEKHTHAFHAHPSQSSTSADGFANRRHEIALGQNASTRTTMKTDLWNQHNTTQALIPRASNSNSNKAPASTPNSHPPSTTPTPPTSSQRSTSQQTPMASSHPTTPLSRSWETAASSSSGRSR